MKSIPCNTIKNKPPLYILDSNACLEFSRFYYDGKCSSDSHVQFIKNILVEAQNNGGSFQFELAISELSFDYGSNSINAKMAQQLYFGIDSLITKISAKMSILSLRVLVTVRKKSCPRDEPVTWKSELIVDIAAESMVSENK